MRRKDKLSNDEKLKLIRDTEIQTLISGKYEGVSYLTMVFELHLEIFGETCSSCPDKLRGYINKLKKIQTMEKKSKSKTLFVLNKGVLIPIPGTNQSIHKGNITDEKALELLKKNPKRIVLFSQFPKNWKTLTETGLESAEIEKDEDIIETIKLGLYDVPVEEMRGLLASVDVKTNAKKVETLQKLVDSQSTEDKEKMLEAFENSLE